MFTATVMLVRDDDGEIVGMSEIEGPSVSGVAAEAIADFFFRKGSFSSDLAESEQNKFWALPSQKDA